LSPSGCCLDKSFLRDMVGIPCWVEAACAATTEAPHKQWSRRGGIPGEPLALPEVGPVTLCSQKKSSPFRTFFLPAWGRGPWTMPEVERKPGNYLGNYPYRLAPPLDSLCQSPADFKSESK
jgi:hypothetical protein